MGIFRMYTGADGKSVIEELSQDDPILEVTVQVMKTGLTPPLAPSDHLREAEKEQLHPAEQLHTRR
jgi:hypothetical protein